ncbi:hypothetical protein JHK87_031019 [Glycine soja]|nr:hypothetical protein JHK87_031019 [Glycine soja]
MAGCGKTLGSSVAKRQSQGVAKLASNSRSAYRLFPQGQKICRACWRRCSRLPRHYPRISHSRVLELVGNAVRDNKKTRVVSRHIRLAMRNDEELNNA